MNIFTAIGNFIIKLFSLIGSIILGIPKIPEKLRGVDTKGIRKKIDSEDIKENLNRFKESTKSTVTNPTEKKEKISSKENIQPNSAQNLEDDIILISAPFSSEDKERTIFILQIVSAGFLFLSIIYIFNFISLPIFIILGVILVAYLVYTLFQKVKVMYGPDFHAYRDFFLMYILVGIILVLVGTNSNFVMAFSFEFFPSLSLLIFALIAVAVVFLIFRMRYSRDFTFGKVLEAGENTAYVKIDYDIRSNVKPDLYIVDNHYGAKIGDDVKLKVDGKIISGGNKPVSIIGVMKKI
ncbi:MAG: DUF2101 family protein [Methanobacteriaceae archaeon]